MIHPVFSRFLNAILSVLPFPNQQKIFFLLQLHSNCFVNLFLLILQTTLQIGL